MKHFDHLAWKKDFIRATEQKSGFKELRAAIFQETIELVKSGGYTLNGNQVKIDNEIISRFYDERYVITEPHGDNHSGAIPRNEFNFPYAAHYDTMFSVINADCLETALVLITTGLNPCVLNLANRQNPGGGVLRGSGAQEENIFRRTNLFMSLYQFAPYAKEYGLPTQDEGYPLDKNYGGIYSKNITVFRGSEKNGYCLLQSPYNVSIATVAALNKPELVKTNSGYFLIDSLIEPTKRKIRTILEIAGTNGHDSLVLGAFGCGAFQNPPNHIAQLFYDVFQEKTFKGKFKCVIFAIFEDHNSWKEHNPNGNVLPFLEVFEKAVIKEKNNAK